MRRRTVRPGPLCRIVLGRVRGARVRALLRDQQGSAAVAFTVLLSLAIGVSAITIDGSNYYYLKRKQQAATDLAALAAATDLTQPSGLAATAAQANGYAAAAVTTVQLGSYTPDASLQPAQRFVSGGQPANAVQVVLQTQPSFIFGGALSALVAPSASASTPIASSTSGTSVPAGFLLKTQSIAATQNLATFALGTSLAQLNGGVENAVLSALLGTQVSASVMDWQSLASVNVDMFAYAKALATRAQLTGATYDTVAAATVSRAQALGALGDVLGGAGGNAFGTVLATAGLGGGSVPVADLISFGPWGALTVADQQPVKATVGALDLLRAVLEIANGSQMVQGSISAPVAGIASATFLLAIGQPVLTSSLITVGTVGATLHSAQTRAFLTLQVPGPLLTVNLPLYVEVGSGTAQLSAIQCSASAAQQVTLSVAPAAIDGWIGSVSASDMTNLTASPNPGPATLLDVAGLARVTGRAHATIGNLSSTPVAFSQADIAAVTRKAASTTDYTASLYASLLSNLQMNVSTLGIVSPPIGLGTSVNQILAGAAIPVDQLLTLVFGALGVNIGNATTWVSAAACGRSIIVN